MKIYYISDLHFDYKSDEEKQKFFNLLNTKDLYLFAGDFYNDWLKTLKLIEELEQKKINGFWILGNHEFCFLAEPANVDPNIKELKIFREQDFIVQKASAYNHFIDVVKKIDEKNKYMKFLNLGDIVEINKKWKLIGDTGWTKIDLKNSYKYEWNHVHNWKWVNERNKKWISFMNKQIKNNDNLIILTHHPFYTPNTFKEGSRFLKKKDGEIQFWFSNKNAKIPGNKKIIFIHGHTHDDSYDEKHLTNAIGRKENSKELKLSFIDLQNF